MRMKVYDGTPLQSGESLCEACRHSTITRGRRADEEIVRCEANTMSAPLIITFPVTSCTAFVDGDLPTYSELFEKAWILKPHAEKRTAGFVRASELSYEDRCRLAQEMREDEDY
jgi:hypothetical protein